MKFRNWRGMFFAGLAVAVAGLFGAGCAVDANSGGGGGHPIPTP